MAGNQVITVKEADGSSTLTDVEVLGTGRQAAAASKSVAMCTEDQARGTFHAASASQLAISCNASGDNIIVTRSVGTIKVYGILLLPDSGVGMKFKNGAGADLTGVMQVGSLFLPMQYDPYFTTTGTNNFILNLSSAVQVSGVIYYLDN